MLYYFSKQALLLFTAASLCLQVDSLDLLSNEAHKAQKSIMSTATHLSHSILDRADVSTRPMSYVSPQSDFLKIETLESVDAIHKKYRQTGYSRSPKQKIADTDAYFSENILNLDCIEHIKFMNINYSCVEDHKEIFPRDTSLFLVEKNFEKYYMRLEDVPVKYEILLEKSLKIEGLVLHLLEHKIIKSRFIGIYRHEPNSGLLDTLIRSRYLDKYQIYTLMHSLAQMIFKILEDRDAKNPLLNINLHPTNVMLVDSRYTSVKLVKVVPSIMREIVSLSVPEQRLWDVFVDKRSKHVYILGKLFYFLCFRVFPKKVSKSMLDFLSNAHDHEGDFNYDSRIVYMIRNMLNNSPVDRPSLSEVLGIIHDVKSDSSFFFDRAVDYLESVFRAMKSELEMEVFKFKAQQNEMFRSPDDVHDLDALPRASIDSQEKQVPEADKFLEAFFKLRIRTDVNTRDKFGMIKDIVIEDLVDETLRETLNKRRKKHFSIKNEDVRDKLEAVNDFAPSMKVIQEYLDQPKKIHKFLKKTEIEFMNLMKDELRFENHRLMFETVSHEHDHAPEEFPLEYIGLLVLTVVIICVCGTSLFFRNSEHKHWDKSRFDTFLIV